MLLLFPSVSFLLSENVHEQETEKTFTCKILDHAWRRACLKRGAEATVIARVVSETVIYSFWKYSRLWWIVENVEADLFYYSNCLHRWLPPVFVGYIYIFPLNPVSYSPLHQNQDDYTYIYVQFQRPTDSGISTGTYVYLKQNKRCEGVKVLKRPVKTFCDVFVYFCYR